MSKHILIVAAHPDDEVLGCGGTVSRLVREGYEAHTLVLGEGLTSRDEKRDRTKKNSELKKLKNQILNSNKLLGVKDIFIYDFPDNRFDTIPLLDIIKIIEKIIRNVEPDVIFTHYKKDLNIDHRITHQAVLTASRPLSGVPVREIYSFEILSSTEYNYPMSFSPNVFFDISDDLDNKIDSMKIYTSEIKVFPHPRSPEGIKLNAEYRGMQVGVKYAEAFQLIRMIR